MTEPEEELKQAKRALDEAKKRHSSKNRDYWCQDHRNRKPGGKSTRVYELLHYECNGRI